MFLNGAHYLFFTVMTSAKRGAGLAKLTEMGAGASVKRTSTSLQSEVDRLRERELDTEVG